MRLLPALREMEDIEIKTYQSYKRPDNSYNHSSCNLLSRILTAWAFALYIRTTVSMRVVVNGHHLIVGRSLIEQLRINTVAMITQLDTPALDRPHASDRAFPSKPRHGLGQSLERFKDRLQIGSREKDAPPQFQTLSLKRRGAKRWTRN
jgi:hypothetical protein